ncbi:MAG TPA: carboxypeptidase-like regulatory domain-containing protein [Puia sp.]|nr:carboxypeptidase-like regulatory domain-containing protein [Puia sp.]
MKKLLIGATIICFALSSFAQNKFTLTGYVKDSLSGETLIGATLAIDGKATGVNSNQYGFFSITLPSATYIITCSYVGYQPRRIQVDLSKNAELNFLLPPKISTNEEVVVHSRKRDANVKNTQMGQISISADRVKTLPVLFGEVDIMKSLQLLPGVRNAGEGNTGLYVRGGGPDQNLIMLDDAIVYNTGHLFGFFSIFNSDAIKNITLIKGDMPAQYGGRISSVVDVTMKEGNINKFQRKAELD